MPSVDSELPLLLWFALVRLLKDKEFVNEAELRDLLDRVLLIMERRDLSNEAAQEARRVLDTMLSIAIADQPDKHSKNNP